MPDLSAPSLNALLSVGGASILTMILVEVLKRLWNPTDAQKARFLPLLSLATGIFVVLFASFGLNLVTRLDLFQGVLTGIFAGAGASGLYDLLKSPTA